SSDVCSSDLTLEKIKKEKFDLILLDLMLPKIHGIDVCRKLKNNKETSSIPIIMLTAKSSEMDKVTGLEIGADDYITKPFSVREVLARVKAVLRRSKVDTKKNPDKIIKIDKIIIDLESYEVIKDNQVVDLTHKEFLLLKILAENRGKVLS